MNEIYKAIEHFEHLQKRYTTQHNGKHCELVKTALAALHEKVEREKGCYHCINSSKKIFAQKERYSNASETGIAYETIRVVFCPSCGKRLEVEHDRTM